MSDPREITHRGRRYVVRTSTVGGQVYYHVCPYSGHNPFAKDVMYIYNEGIAKQIMDLLEIDARWHSVVRCRVFILSMLGSVQTVM